MCEPDLRKHKKMENFLIFSNAYAEYGYVGLVHIQYVQFLGLCAYLCPCFMSYVNTLITNSY